MRFRATLLLRLMWKESDGDSLSAACFFSLSAGYVAYFCSGISTVKVNPVLVALFVSVDFLLEPNQ